MTQEQYEKLKEYDKELKWAVRSSFVHMTNQEFSKVAALYKEVYGEGLTTSQMTCNTCRLKALKRLGEEYLKMQQDIANEEEEKRKQIEELGGVVQPIDKKKVGRKKKVDIN